MVPLCLVQAGVVVLLEIQVPLVEQAVSGEAIPQAAVARRRHLGPIIAAATGQAVSSAVVMVAAEPALPQAEHWVEMAELPVAVVVEVVELEPEARCEYGPGNSEHCRTERPGCAEA